MRLEKLLGIWRLASRWGMCLGIGVWSIIGGGMRKIGLWEIKKQRESADINLKIDKIRQLLSCKVYLYMKSNFLEK